MLQGTVQVYFGCGPARRRVLPAPRPCRVPELAHGQQGGELAWSQEANIKGSVPHRSNGPREAAEEGPVPSSPLESLWPLSRHVSTPSVPTAKDHAVTPPLSEFFCSALNKQTAGCIGISISPSKPSLRSYLAGRAVGLCWVQPGAWGAELDGILSPHLPLLPG